MMRWADQPLGTRLAALVATGAVATTAVALIAGTALAGTGQRAEVLMDTTTATGLALEADMMHDAVRGDVLQALLAGDGPQYDSAATDLDEHSARLRATLEQVAGLGLGADVTAAVADVTPAVDTYLTSAEQLVADAGQDLTVARAAYPDFLTAFEGLETALPQVGATVGGHAAGAVAASTEQREAAVRSLVVVSVAGLLLSTLVGWGVTR